MPSKNNVSQDVGLIVSQHIPHMKIILNVHAFSGVVLNIDIQYPYNPDTLISVDEKDTSGSFY